MSFHKIPRKADAGIAFAGVQLSEAAPLVISFFAALLVGSLFGWIGYVGVPCLGYVITKMYLEWKKGRLPGHLSVLLYVYGIIPFSKAFDRKNKVFIGNGAVINPASNRLINTLKIEPVKVSKNNGS